MKKKIGNAKLYGFFSLLRVKEFIAILLPILFVAINRTRKMRKSCIATHETKNCENWLLSVNCGCSGNKTSRFTVARTF
jgi:hypothetical protein